MRRDKRIALGVPLLPYTTMIMSNLLWVSYGCLKWIPTILQANGTGLVLGTIYFIEFLRLTPAKTTLLPGTVLQHIQALLLTVTFILVVLLWWPRLYPDANPADILGSVGVLFSITMFASPLVSLRTVMKTQSARTISLPFTLASIINNALWGIVGYWDMDDPHIYIQGAMGLTFGMIQLVVKMWYGDEPRSARIMIHRQLKRTSSDISIFSEIVKDEENVNEEEHIQLLHLRNR
jgi:solute carrier family 50 protein (sugar transporter)